MFVTSADTAKLDEALAKAQGELLVASKGKLNQHFKNKYADITAVWNACRAALAKYGISVTQWPLHSEDGRLHMVTRLACAGEWMRALFSIPVSKQDPQGYGSATTYAKRFALAAAVGVVTDDEDDDGQKANETQEPERRQPAPAREPGADDAPDVSPIVVEAARQYNVVPSKAKEILSGLGFASSKDVRPADVERVVAAFKAHAAAQEQSTRL